jgi:uncharacterized protein (TIGR02996 family)
MNEGFLDALRDSPEDVTRLVYADWLSDQGDETRAEFIRLQVRLERLHPHDPDRPALEARGKELIAAHGNRWLGEKPSSLCDFGFRGGLVDRLVFDSNAKREDVEPLLLRHPVSDLVVQSTSILRPLACSPSLSLIRGLTVRTDLSPSGQDSLCPLLDSPWLGGLRSLALHGRGIDNHLARALAKASGLKDLRRLQLHATFLSDAGVVALLKPGVLPKLEEWDVHCPNASWVGLEHLFAEHRAPRWKALSYTEVRSDRDIRFGWFTRTGGLSRCVNLRRLRIHLPQGLSAGMEPAAWLRPLRQLRELYLAGAVGAIADGLASWPGLARLERLHLQVDSSCREMVRGTIEAAEYRNPATVVTV